MFTLDKYIRILKDTHMSQPVVKYSTGPLPIILMEASKVYTERIIDKTC